VEVPQLKFRVFYGGRSASPASPIHQILEGSAVGVHAPVLVETTIEFVGASRGGDYVDATAGAGGHTHALLAAGATRVFALDADIDAVQHLRERFGGDPRVEVAHGNFRDLSHLAPAHGFEKVDGVVFDLGLSSDQLSDPSRGFSFQLDGPLDMRFDTGSGRPALDLVNGLSEPRMADLLRQFGDERRAGRIARRIVQRRPIASTGQLAAAVRSAVPGRSRIHPATRTFQAFRMATNDELGALLAGLSAARGLATPNGRVVVISFHSHEDRIAKHQFRAWSSADDADILTRSPVRADTTEVAANRRSRSAKLRAARLKQSN